MNRRGMTLVELLVAMVAAAFVMGAVYQVLLTTQRTYTVQREQIAGQQTVRAGSEVLLAELREMSSPEGDLISMGERQAEFRAMRSFGFVCGINASQSQIWVLVRGQEFQANQTALVHIDNDPGTGADDVWTESNIQGASTDASGCAQSGDIQRLNVSGLASGDFSGMRIGAPIRSAETYTYGTFQVDGQWYLARRTAGGSAVPLVGPLDGETGLRFEYLDENGTATATAAQVRRIRVTLRTRSDATDRAGNPLVDSLTANAFLRN